MAKLTLADLASLANETSAIDTINANGALIETAMENTLSRDGTSPNQMEADLDLNGNFILNLATPTSAAHAATKAYVDSALGSGAAAEAWAITVEDTLVPVSAGGNGTTDYSALHWAAKAEAYAAAAEGFADAYAGPSASDPSTRLDGSALVEGDLYYNTGSNALFVYNGASWDQAAASTAGLPTLAGGNTWTNTNVFSNGAVNLGVDDTTPGLLTVYGGGNTEDGGGIHLYNAADHDTNVAYFSLRPNANGDLAIGRAGQDDVVITEASGGVLLAQASGVVNIGLEDTTRGVLSIYGPATGAGGLIRLHQTADEDGTYFYEDIYADGGGLIIGNNVGLQLVLDGAGALTLSQYGAGVLVTDSGGAVTADSSTYLKASGNSLSAGTGASVWGTSSTGSITILVVESGTIKTATLSFTELPEETVGGGGP